MRSKYLMSLYNKIDQGLVIRCCSARHYDACIKSQLRRLFLLLREGGRKNLSRRNVSLSIIINCIVIPQPGSQEIIEEKKEFLYQGLMKVCIIK